MTRDNPTHRCDTCEYLDCDKCEYSGDIDVKFSEIGMRIKRIFAGIVKDDYMEEE
jgi:hypothetical protein